MSKAASATENEPAVLFAITQSGSRANGGLESITLVVEQLQSMRRLVVTHGDGEFSRRWQAAGAQVRFWPMSSLRVAQVLRNNLRTFRLVGAEGCRVVHCNDISAFWHTAVGARLAGAKVILNIRNIKPPSQRYGWRWQVARRLSQRQIVLSREMQSEFGTRLGHANGHHNEIDYIYSLVDPARFSPAEVAARASLRARFGIAEDSFAVGCVGSFDPRKGQLELISEVAPLFKSPWSRTKLFFIGDFAPEQNEYARRCRDVAAARGAEELISFVGYSAEMSDWYRALDVVVIASRNEGLARSMIESLACGTPVVSFDVCSAREILEDHECGIVVRRGDYQELFAAITMLEEKPELRRGLGSAGTTVARELFDPARTVARYEDVYSSLLKH